MQPQSEFLRTRLAEIFAEWRAPFAACISRRAGRGEIAIRLRARRSCRVSALVLAGRDPAHEGRAQRRAARTLQAIAFATVFKEPTPEKRRSVRPSFPSSIPSGLSGGWLARRAGRAVPARQSDLILHLAKHPARSSRRSPIASRQTSSASVNPASPTSLTASRTTSRYLDAFIGKRGIGSAYLVAQDWGTALAFHLAERRPDFVRGLVFMEFIRPMPTWEDFHRTDG